MANLILIKCLAGVVQYLVIVLPCVFVGWQAAFPLFLGSRRHLRSLGASIYVSGLSLLMGSIARTQLKNTDYQLVALVIAFFLGLFLPFVVVIVRETEEGELVFSKGPGWARFLGVTTYLFCAYLVRDLSKLGAP